MDVDVAARTTVIPAVKGRHREFQFIAEAYWDLEWELQQQSFDFSYDKKLSFREQTMLEKAKFLIISEVSNADKSDHSLMESEIHALIESACTKHRIIQPTMAAAA